MSLHCGMYGSPTQQLLCYYTREKKRKIFHLWKRASPTYSFPALCCAFTSRVARSMHTIRHPVTLGSRVPLCPVFSTRRMRLIHATTLWFGVQGGWDGMGASMVG